MSAIRVLVGTQKGAFIITSDGKRSSWNIDGPLFGGWGIYHMKGRPVDPILIYAAQSCSWYGQVLHRSDDRGKTWESGGTEFTYDGLPGPHQRYDGTAHPWEFTRFWHLQPARTDPDTL